VKGPFYLTLYISTTSFLPFILTFSPDECQTKSFEKMNMLLSAIFKIFKHLIRLVTEIYLTIPHLPLSVIRLSSFFYGG